MRKKSLVATGLFLLGCATGGAASHMVEPARAQNDSAPEARQHWQYRCVRVTDLEKFQGAANQLGNQGWEMVTAVLTSATPYADLIWCFKR
jgi:hypothetical protein